MKTIAMTFLVIYNLNASKEFKGTVLNIEDSKKIENVMVVTNKVDTTYTDSNGVFVVKNINGINSVDFKLSSTEKNDFILVSESIDSLSVTKNKILIAEKN